MRSAKLFMGFVVLAAWVFTASRPYLFPPISKNGAGRRVPSAP